MNVRAVLAVNAGSSSLKIALYAIEPSSASAPERLLARGKARGINTGDRGLELIGANGETLISEELLGRTHTDAFRRFADILQRFDFPFPDAVGHRLVHGGPDIDTHRLVTPSLLGALRKVAPLASIHLPTELHLIETCEKIRPGIRQAACFDTAFHGSMLPRWVWTRDCVTRTAEGD